MFLTLDLQGSTNLEHIQIIKKVGGKLTDSYLDEGRITLKLAWTFVFKLH